MHISQFLKLEASYFETFKLSHKLPKQQHNVFGVIYFGKQGGCNGFKGTKKFYYAYSATFTLLFFLIESLLSHN